MRNVTSDAAARSIQTACLHLSERLIPENVVVLISSASAAGFDKQKGFFLQIDNRTPYTITKLVVRVKDLSGSGHNDYVVDYFEPEAVALGSMFVKDRYAPEFHSIQSGQTSSFRVPITERAESQEEFTQKFMWGVVRAWGFSIEPGPKK
jgi:hypothetical protein